MTTLDFTKYNNLKSFDFSKDLIQRTIDQDGECVDSLRRISFDNFLKFTDLDDFEGIGCDFGNLYEWIVGQELKDNAPLLDLKILHNNNTSGYLGFTSNGTPDGKAEVRSEE